jgi:hypothetical protein
MMSLPGLCSGLVRLARGMRSSKFQETSAAALDKIAEGCHRREVATLPGRVRASMAKNTLLWDVIAGRLTPEQRKLCITLWNDDWDNPERKINFDSGESGVWGWVHWCPADLLCCKSEEESQAKARECLAIIVGIFESEPLLYRWKHWEPFEEYCLRGVCIGGLNVLLFMVSYGNERVKTQEPITWDEDAADITPVEKQAVRLNKSIRLIGNVDFKNMLFQGYFGALPIAAYMDKVSAVETGRIRVLFRARGLSLPYSKNTATVRSVKADNWAILSGAAAQEAIKEYTGLLTTPNGHGIYADLPIQSEDLFEMSLRCVCEAYRRLYMISKRDDIQTLEIGFMNNAEASAKIHEMSSKPACCSSHSLTLVLWLCNSYCK